MVWKALPWLAFAFELKLSYFINGDCNQGWSCWQDKLITHHNGFYNYHWIGIIQMARSWLGLGNCQMVIIHPPFPWSSSIVHTIWKFHQGCKLTELWSKVIMAWSSTVMITNSGITVVITVLDLRVLQFAWQNVLLST